MIWTYVGIGLILAVIFFEYWLFIKTTKDHTTLWCLLGWHNWSEWEAIPKRTIEEHRTHEPIKGQRVCQNCGNVQFKKMIWDGEGYQELK